MTNYFRNKAAYAFFLLPALALFLFTVLLPILWSLGYSLFSWDGIGDFKFVGLRNYGMLLFDDDTFWQSFRNNIFYVVINTVFQLVVGLLIAILLTKIKRGNSIFQTMYFTPAVISSVAISQIFQKILSIEPVGLLNFLLQSIGLENLAQPWLSNPGTALVSVSLVEAYRFTGIYMIIFYTALISIPSDCIEAANLDGAVGFKLFRYIKYPLIKGVIAVTAVMVVNGSLKGFDIPFILTNGGPGRYTELIATYMYKTAFLTAQFGYGSAMAVFLALESMIMVAFLRKVYS